MKASQQDLTSPQKSWQIKNKKFRRTLQIDLMSRRMPAGSPLSRSYHVFKVFKLTGYTGIKRDGFYIYTGPLNFGSGSQILVVPRLKNRRIDLQAQFSQKAACRLTCHRRKFKLLGRWKLHELTNCQASILVCSPF